MRVVKNLRKNLRFGFGGGGGGGGAEEGGGGGVRGTLLGGIEEAELGVAGVGEEVAVFAFSVVATAPGGNGSDVLGLADPGRTVGFEPDMLGF